jgi:nucleoside-diphosphate kinase
MARTLSIIKPDATKRNITGKVNSMIEAAGFRIVAQKRIWLTKSQAEQFYAVHNQRPFYNDLVKSMTAGPVVVQVLEAENAVALYRNIMGATNPESAEAGTIRKALALNIEENTVHGSDSDENAAQEIAFFFAGSEIVG